MNVKLDKVKCTIIVIFLLCGAFINLSFVSYNVKADNVVSTASGGFNITETFVNTNTSISLTINITGTGNVTNVNITAPIAFDADTLWVEEINTYVNTIWTSNVSFGGVAGIILGQQYSNVTLTDTINSTSPNDFIIINFTATSSNVTFTNALFDIALFNGTGPNSGPIAVTENGNLWLNVTDITPPNINETTGSLPYTNQNYNITANITDDVIVDSVWILMNMTSIEGYFEINNFTMNPSYWREIPLWANATKISYGINANDTSGNMNQTTTELFVIDNIPSSINHTPSGIPYTGDSLLISANVTDNIQVASVTLHYYFTTTTGNTTLKSVIMNNFENDTYIYYINIKSNALVLHYNISVVDSFLNYNSTLNYSIAVIDNDSPSSTCTVNGYWFNSPIAIDWAANDNINLASFEVWYNYSSDNITWDSGKEAMNIGIEGSELFGIFDFVPDAEGYYRFTTNATDNSSLNEAKINYDSQAGFDETRPNININEIIYSSDYIWHENLSELFYSDEMGFENAQFVVEGSASDVLAGLHYMNPSSAFEDTPPDVTFPLNWSSTYDINILDSGTNIITFTAFDHAGNFQDVSITCYEDLTKQISIISIETPSYIAPDSTQYITSATKISLNSTQGQTGVRNIEYKIDDGLWSIYGGEITILTEGVHNLYYRTIDNVSNIEDFNVRSLVVDNSPPVTSISIDHPSTGTAPVYITSYTKITLSPSDTSSGVNEIYYRIDDGSWNTYSNPFDFNGQNPGIHTIFFRSTDMVNNSEATLSYEIYVDDQEPSIHYSISGMKYGNNPTYVSIDSSISFLTDDTGCGVRLAEYQIDTASWLPYLMPIIIDDTYLDGNHNINFQTKDKLDNLNQTSINIFVDSTPPETTLSFDNNNTVDDEIYSTPQSTYSLNSLDIGVKLKSTEFKFDDNSWIEYVSPFSVPLGTNFVYFYSVDNLGNEEPIRSFEVTYGNGIPVIQSNPITEIYQNGMYQYSVDVYDSDVFTGESLKFILIDSPSGMSINENTGYIEWIPSDEQIGNHPISIMVYDSYSNKDWQNFTLEVMNVNDAPYLISPAYGNFLLFVNVNDDFSYQVAVQDDDLIYGDTLTYKLLSSPAGMNIDDNGLISWIPAENDIGRKYYMNISISDISGAETFEYLQIMTVKKETELIGGIVIPEQGTTQDLYKFILMVVDLDGIAPTRTYLIIDGVEHNMSLVSSVGNVLFYEYELQLTAATHNYAFFAESYGNLYSTEWRSVEVSEPENYMSWLSIWAVPLLLLTILIVFIYSAWKQSSLQSELRRQNALSITSLAAKPKPKSQSDISLPEPPSECASCGNLVKSTSGFCGECGATSPTKEPENRHEHDDDTSWGDDRV